MYRINLFISLKFEKFFFQNTKKLSNFQAFNISETKNLHGYVYIKNLLSFNFRIYG